MAIATTIGAAAILSLIAPALAAEEFDPQFYSNTWGGLCATGKLQTPIDLPARFDELPPVPENLVTTVRMPLVKNPEIVNKGSAIQITWEPATAFDMDDDTIFPMVAAGGNGIADVILDPSIVPDRMIKMIPIQLHWHETSEHAWDGLLAAAETHIVTLAGPGQAPPAWGCDAVWEGGDPVLENCTAVFGVMYRLGEPTQEPNYLETAINEAPDVAGAKKPLSAGQLNVDNIIPEDKSYYTYVGSLTTPECNEGLRWHVMNEHHYISSKIMQQLENLHAQTKDDTPGAPTQNFRHNNRPIQPTNGRTIMFHNAGDAEYPGSFSVNDEGTSAAAGVSGLIVPGVMAVLSCLIALVA
uniref:carbonic anhydrase n=1 Tax=Ulva prolifera TaxID=3117 RepID=A0A513QDL2_ULVPR|nr:alpha carbonic anhydrase 1 [Ulva prolifera]